MSIGNQGTGIGSRLKGHTRRGGKKLLKEHCRYAVIATTDEFRSSKPCPFCFVSAQSSVKKEGLKLRINTSWSRSMDHPFYESRLYKLPEAQEYTKQRQASSCMYRHSWIHKYARIFPSLFSSICNLSNAAPKTTNTPPPIR